MKKNYLFLLGAFSLLLGGCNQDKPVDTSKQPLPTSETSSSLDESTSSLDSSSTTNVPVSAGTSENNTTSGTSLNTQTSSTSEDSESTSATNPSVSLMSIQEAINLGNTFKDKVDEKTHEYFDEQIISIKGRVIQDISVYTYQNTLTYLCDGQSMIPVLNSTQDDFHKKIKDYIGKDTSNYTISGKIGYYYSQPCISLTDYELDTSMKFNIDYKTLEHEEHDSVSNYVDFCTTIDYNKKGSGVDKLVKMSGLKCIAKADDNSWLFSDGQYVLGGYMQTSNTYFTIGKYYDLYGISHVIRWKPSLNVLEAVVNNEKSFEVDIPSLAVEKTSDQMYKIGAPDDDIEKSSKTNEFLISHKYFYVAKNQYFNYYTKNGSLYIVSSEKYYDKSISSQETSTDTSHHSLWFNNKTFNRINSEGDVNRLSVADYVLNEVTLDVYFVAYQYTKINKRMVPQVYMFEEYVVRLSFPEQELRSFFAGQSYLFSEGQLPIPYFEGADWYIIQTSGTFIVKGVGITKEQYDQEVKDLNNNKYLKYDSNKSTETHLVWKHNKNNPKFYYGMSYDEANQALTVDYSK